MGDERSLSIIYLSSPFVSGYNRHTLRASLLSYSPYHWGTSKMVSGEATHVWLSRALAFLLCPRLCPFVSAHTHTHTHDIIIPVILECVCIERAGPDGRDLSFGIRRNIVQHIVGVSWCGGHGELACLLSSLHYALPATHTCL